ncbi:MAG: transglutaminase [Clostridiales bacterium 38-18]|nr:MAG: transglutaminase [Clostridiales bacterium 38-18]
MLKKFLTVSVLLLVIVIGVSFGEAKPTIDTSSLDKGIVDVTYKATDGLKYKVLISKDDTKITYPFSADGKTETFPLQLGNGTYKVGLLKNVSGTKYVYVTQQSVTLNLKDPNIVYLNSVQNVNWNEDLKAIAFGQDLLKKSTTNSSRLETLYKYLVKNMSYDYDKIPTLTSDYIPSVEKTYEDLKGICYDYSALFASIEREQGIPTKLVKGYSKYVEGYHAWNEILIDGKWYIIDNTVDSTWKGSTATLVMKKNEKYYTKVYEY